MAHKLEPYYDFFARPLDWPIRLLLLLSVAVLPLAWQGPLWRMSFQSNQYPDPLRLAIHIDHLEGQLTSNRDDLREINTLNHYIGMRPLLESDFTEFVWLPFVIGIIGLLILRLVAFGRLRDLVDVFVLYVYFGLFSMWTFYSKLHTYGHQLDPEAPIKVKPFTPPMLGSVQIANFRVNSYPDLAAYVLTASAALVALALLFALLRGWRDYRRAAAPRADAGGRAATAAVTGAVLLIGCWTAAAGTAAGDEPLTLICGAGQPYATAADGLAAAQPGDTVVLTEGQYDGDLVVGAGIHLVGRGAVVIQGSGRGNAVTVEGADAVVEHLVIRGSGHDMMHSHAGVRVAGDRTVVRDCRLEGNLFGIYVAASEGVRVESCEIRGPQHAGLGSRGAGVHLYASNHCVIHRNHVREVRDGIYFDHADHNLVEDNLFEDLRYGVHYMYCGPNEFYRNTFRDSMAGVAIMYTDGVRFTDNQILNNRSGHNAFGLLYQACKNCVAERNVIVNNTCGFFLEGAHHNQFRHNLVAYNDVGAIVFGSSLDNVFEANDFIENLATLRTVGRPGLRWSTPQAGNYYSDYAGYDLDRDGRGDVPHKLESYFEHLTGGHPLLQLYLGSAAATALLVAEQSFPLLPERGYADPSPAMQPVAGVQLALQPDDVLRAHGSVPAAWSAAGGLVLMLGLARRLAR